LIIVAKEEYQANLVFSNAATITAYVSSKYYAVRDRPSIDTLLYAGTQSNNRAVIQLQYWPQITAFLTDNRYRTAQNVRSSWR